MNRKVYQQPELQIVNINIETVMTSTSNIDEVKSSNPDVDVELGGGSDGHGRSRMNSIWTEEDGEEEDQF